MFRLLARGAYRIAATLRSPITIPKLPPACKTNVGNFSTLISAAPKQLSLLSNARVLDISNNITRTLIKYSWGKGRRKTVKAVLKKFYRLNWGMWIHTKCGRNKKLWKKSSARKRRLRQHVMCNATQCTLLDKMVNRYWRKPKYYVDDPYQPYHTREEFRCTYTKPRPYIPEDTKQTISPQ